MTALRWLLAPLASPTLADVVGVTRRWLGNASLIATCLLACAPTTPAVHVGAMLQDVRTNELAALAKYKDTRLLLGGVVLASGARRVEKLRAEHSYPSVWGGWSSELKSTAEHYPYVYIAGPDGPGQGVVLCYFSPDDVEQVSLLTRGTNVEVSGVFQEPAHTSRGLEVVFYACEVEKR